MHLGIFAKTFPRPTLEETLDAIVDHGLTHVQFNLSCVGLPTLPDRLDEDWCISIARAFRDRGLTMDAISGTFNLCEPDNQRLLENFQRLGVLAAACRWLDTRIITLCTGTLDPGDMWRWHPGNVRRSTWESLVGSMRQAVQIADRHEVILAFEPEINNVVNSVSKARRLLDEIDSPWLKVVIDPANLFREGDLARMKEILDEAFDWLGPDIILAHAKAPSIDEKLGEDGLRWLLETAEPPHPDFYGKLIELSLFSPYQGSEEDRRLLKKFLTETFFRIYFGSASRMEYTGSIIMHGLNEPEVGQMISFLRDLLRDY
jgi:sugar phosphate isomerase/epimerase